jgi:hypothetical protein
MAWTTTLHYAYSHIPLKLRVAYVNKPKALVAGRGYHVGITTSIPVNRRLAGTIGNYAEGGIEITGGPMGGGGKVDPHRTSFRGLGVVRCWPITQFIIS